ncbi:MAG: hypothetical protein VZR95_04380 [Alphaproteobacteria bacterium]
MTLVKKAVTLSLAAVMVLGTVVNADAAPSRKNQKEDTSDVGAILFRVENIEPVRNKDGFIDRCSFMVTVYNRMEKEVKEAVLELRWIDTISNKYDVRNGEVVVSDDEEASETEITKTVKLSSIMPHRQKSFTSEVATDKCFSLLDNVEYTVKSCINEGESLEMKDSKIIGAGSCTGNFNYINSKNPEYYSEFKDVPDSVLEKQAEEEKRNELAKVNEKQNSILNQIKNVDEILKKIR